MTGEAWNGVMRDCAIAPPFCNDALGECGWPLGSPLYWVSFQVMTAFLFLNVIVAVVLQIFEVCRVGAWAWRQRVTRVFFLRI